MRDTVILGAGVIGAATAYYLSLHGIETTVIERRSVASGASGTAAGLLSAPTPDDLRQPWGELARESLALHFQLAETLGGTTAYGFQPIDTVLVAASEPEKEALIQLFGQERWLDAPAVAAHCRWLLGSSVLGGVLRDGGAQLDPARFTRALLEASGAEVLIAAVEGAAASGSEIRTVTVDGRAHAVANLVVAAGPWSAEVGGWLGVSVPVRPLKGQILRMQVPDAPYGGFADLDGNYVVRKPNGITYTGTTEEEAGFDESPTPEVERQILASASAMAPAIASGTVVERTACLRPLSADNTPIVGTVPGVKGAYLATGHGRKGILLAPATGRALAELISEGRSTSLDLSPFALERFGIAAR